MSASGNASRQDIMNGCGLVRLGEDVGDREISGGEVVEGLEESELWRLATKSFCCLGVVVVYV